MLSHSQIKAVNDAILKIYEPCSLTDLNQLLFLTARKLLPHDAASGAVVHESSSTADIVYDRPARKILEDFAPHVHEIFNMRGVREGQAFTGSSPYSLRDLYSRKEWEASPLYQHLHRPIGVSFDVTLHFYRYSQMKSCHLSIFRQKKAFSHDERLMIELVTPHLNQRYRQLLAAEPAHPYFASQHGTHHWLLCTSAGTVLSHSLNLETFLLNNGFLLRDRLPHSWRDWLKQQLQPADMHAVPQPLTIDLETSRLIIYCLANHLSGEHRLVLQAVAKSNRTFTKREAETARWLAAGKTNTEIADILGISRGTVKKHVEHILAKLHAENRTSAAAMLLSRS